MNRLLTLFSSLALAAAPLSACAHFVWAIADPSTKSLVVEFAESPGDSVLPSFAGKAAGVRLWSGRAPAGPLKADGDRLRAPLTAGAGGVALDYGVIDRRDQGRGKFLLHYYAKAAISTEASQAQLGLPLELAVTKGKGELVLLVRHNGKPAANAEVVAHLPESKEPFEGKTGADGTVRLPSLGAGSLAIRAMVATPAKGADYELVRDYGTLTLQGEKPSKADPAAYAALERASNARQKMPEDIESVTGKIVYVENGQEKRGTFSYEPNKGTTVNVGGLPEATGQALREQVSSIFSHRRGGQFAKGEGQYPITFAGPEEPAGRRIALNDDLHSFYRVRGDELTEVDRTMGGRRFIITILENLRTPQGRTLPKVFAVSYFDPQGKGLTKAEYFNDSYAEVKGIWLPASRRIIVAQEGRLASTEIRFEDLEVKQEGGK